MMFLVHNQHIQYHIWKLRSLQSISNKSPSSYYHQLGERRLELINSINFLSQQIVDNISRFKIISILKKYFTSHLLVTIRRNNTHGGHHTAGLQHHLGSSGLYGSGQESESLLVIKEVAETNLVVHDRLQTLDTLQLHLVPLGVTKIRKYLNLRSL